MRPSKCAFMQESVEYLGHKIDSRRVHTTTSKLDAIQEAPVPHNTQQLRSFLGLLHYYGKFIPNLSLLLHLLNRLLQASTEWKWDEEGDKAFKEAKEKLVSAPILAHMIHQRNGSWLQMHQLTVLVLCYHIYLQTGMKDQLPMLHGHD